MSFLKTGKQQRLPQSLKAEKSDHSCYTPIFALPFLTLLSEKLIYNQLYDNLYKSKPLFSGQSGFTTLVGDTNRSSYEPQGITKKGLQIACALTTYFYGVICRLVLPLKARARNDGTDAYDSVSCRVDSLQTQCVNAKMPVLRLPNKHRIPL